MPESALGLYERTKTQVHKDPLINIPQRQEARRKVDATHRHLGQAAICNCSCFFSSLWSLTDILEQPKLTLGVGLLSWSAKSAQKT